MLERGYLRDVVSRAYYAMFYAAKAAIVSEGLQANKHSSIISLFGRHFAKSGRIAVSLHRAMRTAFERQPADYTLDWQAESIRVPTDEAREAALVEGTRVIPGESLAALVSHPRDEMPIAPTAN